MNALKNGAEQKWCGSAHQVLSALGNLISVGYSSGELPSSYCKSVYYTCKTFKQE